MNEQIEIKVLSLKIADQVVKFIQQDIIYCYEFFWKLVINEGNENIKEVIQLLNKMEIQRIQILAYNPKANEIIEKSYGPIKNAL